MSIFVARVVITPKPVVNDPQGVTVAQGLRRLGFEDVRDARVGKYVEVTLEADRESDARASVDDMCRKLLANGVIEDYRFDLERAKEAFPSA